jgi:hypothetical protein
MKFNIRAVLVWMHAEPHTLATFIRKRMCVEGVQGRCVCTRVDLGFDARNLQFWQTYPFAPAQD